MARGTANQREAGPKNTSKVQLCSSSEFDASSILGLPDEFGLRNALDQQPPNKAIFCEARLWGTRQFYVKEILKLRHSIYNFGFSISAASGKKKDQSEINDWRKENETVIADFNRDAWLEWLTMDNAVALWRKETARPLILSTERVTFNDKFGVEKLTITHGLDDKTIDDLRLSPAEAAELKQNSTLELIKQGNNYVKKSFFFDVVKREKIGMGLAWPGMRAVFQPANGIELLQLGDRARADMLRTAYELHTAGHEIKSGNLAGRSTHFLKNPDAKAIQKDIKWDRKLLLRIQQIVANFDRKISYPTMDPAAFASSRYDAFTEQLVVWSMPLGQMIFAKGVNPFLMTLLKAQAVQEREYVGPFLKRVLTKSLKPPVEINVAFADTVFWDSRLMLDVLKTGLAMGPLSQGTWLTQTGFNKAAERLAKDDESKLPREQVTPLFDAAHGDQKKPGPPPGSNNTNK